MNVRAVLDRVGGSLEARITAVHKRGHVFSMSRSCILKFNTELDKTEENNSNDPFNGFLEGANPAVVVSFRAALRELTESIPLGGVNAAFVALKKEIAEISKND